jgi:hypothetical protein
MKHQWMRQGAAWIDQALAGLVGTLKHHRYKLRTTNWDLKEIRGNTKTKGKR